MHSKGESKVSRDNQMYESPEVGGGFVDLRKDKAGEDDH